MNSRWQASKIGLVNFWYYDEQEFPICKGKDVAARIQWIRKIGNDAKCCTFTA